MAHPLLWELNRPAIQEAAIVSGQAFLLAGLFLAMPLYEGGTYRPIRLLIVGTLWSLAVGTRLVLIGAIGVFLLLILLIQVREWLSGQSGRSLASYSAALLAPLAISALSLGAYNQVRFGSPFESGWGYYLGGRGDFSQGLSQAFHVQLLVPNLYNYIGRHVNTLTVFPYIKPLWGRDTLSPLPFALPDKYYAEQVTGVLIASPFVLYAAYLAKWFICIRPQSSVIPHSDKARDQGMGLMPGFSRLAIIFGSGTIFAALPLVFFAIVATRYMLDATQLLAITAVLGCWAFYYSNRHSASRRLVASLAILATMAVSVISSFLLAVTGFEARFEHLNPELFEQITRFFAR